MEKINKLLFTLLATLGKTVASSPEESVAFACRSAEYMAIILLRQKSARNWNQWP